MNENQPNDAALLPTEICATLPDWVVAEAESARTDLGTVEGRMTLVNALARRNFVEGSGGPFAALVYDLDSQQLVSAGVNLVLSSGLSSLHAEVTTLSLAQVAHRSWDLSDARMQLVVNWRPCAMCYGATIWSGVRELVIAGSGPELEQITGFNEGPVRDDWREQAEQRGIAVIEDVLRDEAIAVFEQYAASGAPVYNPGRG